MSRRTIVPGSTCFGIDLLGPRGHVVTIFLYCIERVECGIVCCDGVVCLFLREWSVVIVDGAMCVRNSIRRVVNAIYIVIMR